MRWGSRRRPSSVSIALAALVLAVAPSALAATAPVAAGQSLAADVVAGGSEAGLAVVHGPDDDELVVVPRDTTRGVGPAQPTILHAMAAGVAHPEAAPPGANDWTCRPTPERPYPVVLVHGTWLNAYTNWAGAAPALKAAGYCVFALNYGTSSRSYAGDLHGVNATAPIRESARELGGFVDAVLAATGAEKVDLLGHSQGGLVGRTYVTLAGGADAADPARPKVRTLVSVAGSYHDTSLGGLAHAARWLQSVGMRSADNSRMLLGPAITDQLTGSELLRELDSHGDTVPGVRYAALATRHDEVVNPYESQFIAPGPGAEVHNLTLQDGCDQDLTEHGSLVYSRRGLHLVRQVLGDPDAAGPAPCEPTAFVASSY